MTCDACNVEMAEREFDPRDWTEEIPDPGSKVYECPSCGVIEAYEPED